MKYRTYLLVHSYLQLKICSATETKYWPSVMNAIGDAQVRYGIRPRSTKHGLQESPNNLHRWRVALMRTFLQTNFLLKRLFAKSQALWLTLGSKTCSFVWYIFKTIEITVYCFQLDQLAASTVAPSVSCRGRNRDTLPAEQPAPAAPPVPRQPDTRRPVDIFSRWLGQCKCRSVPKIR